MGKTPSGTAGPDERNGTRRVAPQSAAMACALALPAELVVTVCENVSLRPAARVVDQDRHRAENRLGLGGDRGRWACA
jgi:hypothetical protein